MKLFSGFRPVRLVAALGALFGTVMISAPGILRSAMSSLPWFGQLQPALVAFSWVFFGIAVYVSGVVTLNTSRTVVAGQISQIALLRVVGATASRLRRSFARQGLQAGITGALLGAGAGMVVSIAAFYGLQSAGLLPAGSRFPLSPLVAAPVIVIIATTSIAVRNGSIHVITVAPMAAFGEPMEPGSAAQTSTVAHNPKIKRRVFVGILLIAAGLLVSVFSPFGALPAALGCFVSFSAISRSFEFLLTPALRLAAWASYGSPVGSLAGRNALRAPARTARSMIGITIGVTLVATFSVALGSVKAILEAARGNSATATEQHATNAVFTSVNLTVGLVLGFCVLIAAVGMANEVSLNATQRRPEFALLRVLGFTSSQVRRLVLVETLQVVFVGVAVGTSLGLFYGWVGVQTLLGHNRLVLPTFPLGTAVAIAVGSVVLAVAASALPLRDLHRLSPVEALTQSR